MSHLVKESIKWTNYERNERFKNCNQKQTILSIASEWLNASDFGQQTMDSLFGFKNTDSLKLEIEFMTSTFNNRFNWHRLQNWLLSITKPLVSDY